MVTDADMPCNPHIISHNVVVANYAIMRNMGIDHKQITATNACDAFILYRAAMNTTGFTNAIVIANFQPRLLALVFEILAVFADASELKNLVTLTDTGKLANDDMGVKHGLCPNCDMFTNNAIRPYLDRRVYRCSGINNRRWVNRHEKSLYQPTIQEELKIQV